MPQYLVTVIFPDDFQPTPQDEARAEQIHALNRELTAAGIRKFAGGLSPVTKSLRRQPDGSILVTDGPYLETKEHIGGLSILECASMDEVLGWARRGSSALNLPGEVREFLQGPPPAAS